ncbi:MAG: SPOR domain-containing protein [Helicobacteraceae bacterium]|jgi:cell division septation protein DedD|nr:SPOR domain-containing protein [Helicobacteraceae bacterium]
MADIIGNQDELNDILIKRDEGSGSKARNALLITAAMLLVAVIAFLTFRVIDASKYEEAQIISPEPTQTVAAVNADPIGKQSTTMFESPQPAGNPDQVRSAIDKIIEDHRKARQNEGSVTPPVTSATPTPTPSVTPTPPIVVAQTPTPSVVTPPPTNVTPTTVTATPTPPKTQTPKPPVTSATQTPKPPETIAAAQPPKTAGATDAGATFYVQIESLAQSPNGAYLKTLRDRGLSIAVRQVVVKGATRHRIYVGPYASREIALAALPTIRRDYSPEAFIVKE